MRYLFWIVLLTIFANISNANSLYRQKLDSAWKLEYYCNQLIKEIEKNESSTNIGYLGVAYIMKSNHCKMPWNKMANFNKGKALLELAIKRQPNNVEMIFYRYEIQSRVPKVLNYNNIAQDKNELLYYINNKENKSKDKELYNKIKEIIG